MTKRSRAHSERVRTPPPLIRSRMWSGRGATEQPNATDDDAALTPSFWFALVVTAIATGLFGDFLMYVLATAQRLAFHDTGGSFTAAVERSSDARRVVVLLIAGVIGGVGWYLVRRFLAHERSEIDDALWEGDGSLSVRRSVLTSVLSEIVVGLGASIGREAAPKLMGGVSGSVMAGWMSLSVSQRRLLVACGGGAGLAAVYNVPLGGALFTAEVLYGSVTLPVVIPAIACSVIATLVARLYLSSNPIYVHVPAYSFSASLMVWSVLAGVVIGLLGVLYVRLLGFAAHHRASGAWMVAVMPLAFLALGALGLEYPQLFGNGLDTAHDAFLGVGAIGLFFALAMLKPFATALCLGSGATGGVFTPMLATGAALGAFLGLAWREVWPGTPVGAFAIVGAAAMVGAVMQAPLAGLVLILELINGGFPIMIPLVAATVIATLLVRHIDGYSIYTARLPRRAHTAPG